MISRHNDQSLNEREGGDRLLQTQWRPAISNDECMDAFVYIANASLMTPLTAIGRGPRAENNHLSRSLKRPSLLHGQPLWEMARRDDCLNGVAITASLCNAWYCVKTLAPAVRDH